MTLLPDLSKRLRSYEMFDFEGTTLAFYRTDVVNDFPAGGRQRNPGGQVEGVLLAVDSGPIPDDFPKGGVAEVKLIIFDIHGNSFTAKRRLLVERDFVYDRIRVPKRAISLESRGRERRLIAAA